MNQFESAGLHPVKQNFELITGVKPGKNNHLKSGDYDAVINKDYIPYAVSNNATVNAPVVFAGYGLEIKIDSIKWNDYQDINPRGKWVMIFKGEPSKGKEADKYMKFTDDLSKILLARDKGAAGIIFVSGMNFSKKDNLPELRYEKNIIDMGIPVIHITRIMADRLLKSKNTNILNLENDMLTKKTPNSFDMGINLDVTTDIVFIKVITQNIYAVLEGNNPVLKNEYVVVGAHMDHLGFGGPGSGSRMPDTIAIHNGADDNASGICGVIELSKIFSKQKNDLKRSIIFIAFGAEEFGLIGSKYFVKNPPLDLKKVKAMFNFDMIGSFDTVSKKLIISGTGTSTESDTILKINDKNYPFDLKFSPEGYGPSDHASFYGVNIPVFFFTTGSTEVYHTPFDDADRINYTGEKLVLEYAHDVIIDVVNKDHDLVFREAGPKSEPARYGSRFKVRLGIMPDYTSSDNSGLRVDAVTKGGPAFNGGMEKGDIIIAFDGKAVKNIYDYMNRLEKLEPGDQVNVDVMRNQKKIVLIIKL